MDTAMTVDSVVEQHFFGKGDGGEWRLAQYLAAVDAHPVILDILPEETLQDLMAAELVRFNEQGAYVVTKRGRAFIESHGHFSN